MYRLSWFICSGSLEPLQMNIFGRICHGFKQKRHKLVTEALAPNGDHFVSVFAAVAQNQTATNMVPTLARYGAKFVAVNY